MIFSRIFSSKGNDNDPRKRLQSIASLQPTNDKDKAKLHQFAFNDEDKSVALAALEKLDSFVLWVKCSQQSTNKELAKIAEVKCVSMLESNTHVSDSLFNDYLLRTCSRDNLQKLLFTNKRLMDDSSLCMQIVEKLDNGNVNRRYFQELATPEQQHSLIAKCDDVKELNRYKKQANLPEIVQAIDDKLIHIQQQLDKPKKVEQQLKLINAKLLALKDSDEYEHIQTQLEQLSKEFDSQKKDLSCLDEAKQASFSEKYLSLRDGLKRKLCALEQAYNEEQQQQQFVQQLDQIKDKCKQIEHQLNMLIAPSESQEHQDISAQIDILRPSANDALSELGQLEQNENAVLFAEKLTRQKSQIETLQTQIEQAPILVERSIKARNLIDKLEQQLSEEIAKQDTSLGTQQQDQQAKTDESSGDAHETDTGDTQQNAQSESLQTLYDSVKQEFYALQDESQQNLPSVIAKQAKQTFKRCREHFSQQQSVLKKQQQKCENKLRVVKRLADQGKYKAALSTYRQAQAMYAEIENAASNSLQRLYTNTEEQVAKIQDWQAYIAQPRKPELIEQARALCDGEFDDPYKRSDDVKRLRTEFNSLGNLFTDEDKALNEEFDSLLEKAFLPCRVFFTEIDKHRENNRQLANELIAQAQSLNSELPVKELSREVSSLRNKFKKLGDIDKKYKRELRKAFDLALKPASDRLTSDREANAQSKQKLIDKAQALLTSVPEQHDLQEATSQAKQLQQKWKQIGFAGKQQDDQLWQQFRKINDSLFAMQQQQHAEKRNEENAALNEVIKAIEAIDTTLTQANDIVDTHFYKEAVANVKQNVATLPKPLQNKAQSTLNEVNKRYDSLVAKLKVQKLDAQYEELFRFLNNYDNDITDSELMALPKRFQSWLTTKLKAPELLRSLDREKLAMVIGITTQVGKAEQENQLSPAERELQLQLMANKLQGNNAISSEDALAVWVSKGPLSEQDKAQLDSFKNHFLSNLHG